MGRGKSTMPTRMGTERGERVFGGLGADEVMLLGGDDTAWGGAGADRIWAGNGNDVLYGGFGSDHFSGDDGNDTLYGEQGDDYLAGAWGNDIVYGGPGNDTLSVGGNGSGTDSLFGGAGNDFLTPENYAASADPASWKWLDGGAGNDTIHGSNGIDTIIGGKGSDIINGYEGDDVAVFDGVQGDYQFGIDDETLTVTKSLEGTDRLTNIEFVRFRGRQGALGELVPVALLFGGGDGDV